MMNGRVSGVGLALLASILAAAVASAQYRPGDHVLAPGFLNGAGHWQPFAVTPLGKAVTLNTPGLHSAASMIPSPDNRGLWISAWGPKLPLGIYEMAPSGAFTTIALTNPKMPAPFLVKPSATGEAIAIDGSGSAVLHVSRAGGVTTLCTYAGSGRIPFGIDEPTGDMYLGWMHILERLRLSPPHTQSTIHLAKGFEFTGYGGYDPHRDEMIGRFWGVFSGQSRQGFLGVGVRPAVRLSTLQAYASNMQVHTTAANVQVDAPNRTAAALLVDLLSNPNRGESHLDLLDLDTRSRIRRLWTGKTPLMWTSCFVRAHSRHLCGISPAIRGGVYSVLVSSPAEPGAYYVTAFSFAMRPGIPLVDGRTIDLEVDALLLASLTDTGLFSNCGGTLDSRGEAVSRVAIPRLAPLAGQRFFAAAITIVNGRIRTISESIGVTIQ